jgi:hypothetical protein
MFSGCVALAIEKRLKCKLYSAGRGESTTGFVDLPYLPEYRLRFTFEYKNYVCENGLYELRVYLERKHNKKGYKKGVFICNYPYTDRRTFLTSDSKELNSSVSFLSDPTPEALKPVAIVYKDTKESTTQNPEQQPRKEIEFIKINNLQGMFSQEYANLYKN